MKGRTPSIRFAALPNLDNEFHVSPQSTKDLSVHTSYHGDAAARVKAVEKNEHPHAAALLLAPHAFLLHLIPLDPVTQTSPQSGIHRIERLKPFSVRCSAKRPNKLQGPLLNCSNKFDPPDDNLDACCCESPNLGAMFLQSLD